MVRMTLASFSNMAAPLFERLPPDIFPAMTTGLTALSALLFVFSMSSSTNRKSFSLSFMIFSRFHGSGTQGGFVWYVECLQPLILLLQLPLSPQSFHGTS